MCKSQGIIVMKCGHSMFGIVNEMQKNVKLHSVRITTAVTTNTCPQAIFSLGWTQVLVDVNQPFPWFFPRWPREDHFPVSPAIRKNMSAFRQFLQDFATGTDTLLSEETQITDFGNETVSLIADLSLLSLRKNLFQSANKLILVWMAI